MRPAIGILLIAGLAQARDWKENPAVVAVSATADIFAIGDAHSDFVRLTNAMRAAGLVDRANHWTADKAVLVTTGDMIDKGPRGIDVVRLMRTLQGEAKAAGGRVVVLAGNHEAEFMADPGAKKVADFAGELRKAGLDPAKVAKCDGDLGAFLCSLPFAARVNEWYFSHAGNTQGRTLAQIENDVERDFDAHGFAAQQLIGDYSILEARLNGEGKGREPWIDAGPDSEKTLLRQYATALGVQHIVEGHVPAQVDFADGVTRKAGQMLQRWGLLFLIDTGMSEGVDDSLGAVLKISGKGAEAVCPGGKRTLLWSGTEDLGRAPACR